MALGDRVGEVVLSKYRVERVLGRGGMGVVVAARHLRLGERVAIKFPSARMAEREDVVSRLVREGRAAMQIRSEHAAKVHDVGVLETGEPYLVMEYLAGRDLAATLAAEGPLPVDAALEYMLQALEALAEAHARGVIHRDIKPSNLFLARRADGSPQIKVIDFGISKFISNESTDSAGMMGSVLYMAPEQMRASRGLDARTDIWSLGATLHALLSGSPPFPGSTLLEVHEALLRGPPPIRRFRPELPAGLEVALVRCMQTEPSARYRDVAELAAALAEFAPLSARISAQRVANVLSARAALAGDSSLLGAEQGAWPASAPVHGTATAAQSEASWLDAQNSRAAPEIFGDSVQPVASQRVARASRIDRRAKWLFVAALLGTVAVGSVVLRRSPEQARAMHSATAVLSANVPAPLPPSSVALATISSPAIPPTPVDTGERSVVLRPALHPTAVRSRVLGTAVTSGRVAPLTSERRRDPLADPD